MTRHHTQLLLTRRPSSSCFSSSSLPFPPPPHSSGRLLPSSPSLLSISAVTLLLPPHLSLTSTFSVNTPCTPTAVASPSFSPTPPSSPSRRPLHQLHRTRPARPHLRPSHTHPGHRLPPPQPPPPSSSSPLPTYRRTVGVRHPLPLSSSPSSPSLHCEVFIDRLHRLSLLTSTRRISLGDTETVLIQATTSRPTSSPRSKASLHLGHSHPSTLSLLPLSTAHVNASARLQQLEAQGITSHLLAVQGKTSGKSTVTATLQQPKGEQPGAGGGGARRARTAAAAATPCACVPGQRVRPAGVHAGEGGRWRRRGRGWGPRADSAATHHSALSTVSLHLLFLRRRVRQPHGRAASPRSRSARPACRCWTTTWREHREALEVDVINPHRLTAELVVSGVGEDEIEARGEGLGRTEADDGWWIRQGSTYRLVVRMKDEHGRAEDFAPNTRVRVQVDGASVAATRPPSLSPRALYLLFTLVDLQAKMLGQSSLTSPSTPSLTLWPTLATRLTLPSSIPILITVTPALSILPSPSSSPPAPPPFPTPSPSTAAAVGTASPPPPPPSPPPSPPPPPLHPSPRVSPPLSPWTRATPTTAQSWRWRWERWAAWQSGEG